MSFDLKIVFNGLCKFVPDPTAGQETMHVLLPDAKKHDRHVAVLYYDEGYATAGGVLRRRMVTRTLENEALIVARGSGGAPQTSLPPQIFDMTRITGRKLGKGQVGRRPQAVVGRVTLGTGKITHCAPGTGWKLEEAGLPSFCMTHQVEWTARAEGSSIILPLQGINGDDGKDEHLTELHQHGGEIRIWVFNVPEGDLPSPGVALTSADLITRPVGTFPMPDHPAHHFMAYYDLYPGVAGKPPRTRSAMGACPAGTETPCAATASGESETAARHRPDFLGADPYNCMVAGGKLG